MRYSSLAPIALHGPVHFPHSFRQFPFRSLAARDPTALVAGHVIPSLDARVGCCWSEWKEQGVRGGGEGAGEEDEGGGVGWHDASGGDAVGETDRGMGGQCSPVAAPLRQSAQGRYPARHLSPTGSHAWAVPGQGHAGFWNRFPCMTSFTVLPTVPLPPCHSIPCRAAGASHN